MLDLDSQWEWLCRHLFSMKWGYCGRVDCEIFIVWDVFVAEKQWEFCKASRHSAITSSNCTPTNAKCVLWSAQLNDAARSISMLLIRLLLLCLQQLVHVACWSCNKCRPIHSLRSYVGSYYVCSALLQFSGWVMWDFQYFGKSFETEMSIGAFRHVQKYRK